MLYQLIGINRFKKEKINGELIKCISTSLILLNYESGIRDSDSRPSAWEANALPTELIPQLSANI